jgi:isopenicillin N synthase-like dioxygenase
MPGTIELRQTDQVIGQVGDSVLCIDAAELAADPEQDLVQAVRDACIETGFFYVQLSPQQQDSVARALRQMQRFFSLPDSDRRKQDVAQSSGDFGWVQKGTEPAYQPGTVSSLEAFDYGHDNVEGMDAKVWPPINAFRSDLTDCWNDYVALGDSVLRVLAKAAGLDQGFLLDRCNSRALNTMRLLHYCEEPEMDPSRDVGIAAHTDFECITLLYQTAPGLELLSTREEWLDAPVQEGRLVILLGDMLERWTNGEFRASGHRVRNTPEQRFSIVQFIAVNDEIEVAPLAEFVSVDSPSAYPSTKQARHIDAEVARAEANAKQLNDAT